METDWLVVIEEARDVEYSDDHAPGANKRQHLDAGNPPIRCRTFVEFGPSRAHENRGDTDENDREISQKQRVCEYCEEVLRIRSPRRNGRPEDETEYDGHDWRMRSIADVRNSLR